jgi:hypothetical protein
MQKPAGDIRKKDIGVVLLISAPIRIFFYSHLHVSTSADTPGYIHAKVNIFKGEIDAFRTPVYPWLLKAIAFLGPTRNFLHDVAIVQACISFASIFFFYKIALYALKTRTAVLAATLLYGISPTLVNFDMCLLTESLSISSMVFFAFLITDYVKGPSAGKAFFYTLFIFLLTMIRPAFIYLYLLMALFWVARMFFSGDGKRLPSWGLLSLALCVTFLSGYKRLNKRVHGSDAISVVSNLNQLELVAAYGLYPNGGDSAITNIIRRDLKDTAQFFLAVLQQSVRNNNISPGRVDSYIRKSISAEPGVFIQKTFSRFFTMQSEPVAAIYAQKADRNASLPNSLMQLDPFNFLCVSLLLLADLALSLLSYTRTRTINWIRSFLWATATTHYLVIFLGARYDHQRLFVVAIPFLILISLYYIDWPLLPPRRTNAPDLLPV